MDKQEEWRRGVAKQIAKILSEYPSHPPMSGSEQGINEVSVNKLLNLMDSLRSKDRDTLIESLETVQKFTGGSSVNEKDIRVKLEDVKQIIREI